MHDEGINYPIFQVSFRRWEGGVQGGGGFFAILQKKILILLFTDDLVFFDTK